MPDPGYDAEVVFAYLRSIGTERADGAGFDTLNDIRITDSHRETIQRWRKKKTVPLGRLDQILHAYDLMLFELEHWAEQHCGTDGFQERAA